MPDTIISFQNASFSYDGEMFALKDVTFDIPRGQLVCIAGNNGSGKSTLARHLNALLVPTEGSVSVLGHDTAADKAAALIRPHVGMVFQSPDDQLIASLVENDVAFGPENLGVAQEELRGRVSEALRAVGLAGFEKREVSTLSGGQKQRLAIAGALAMKPDVLVLDEASAMLDPQGRAKLMDIVCDLHARGMTVVMVTHFANEVAACERVIVLDEGSVVFDGLPEQFSDSDTPWGHARSKSALLGDTKRGYSPNNARFDHLQSRPLITLENVSFTYEAGNAFGRRKRREEKPVGNRQLGSNDNGSVSPSTSQERIPWALRDVSLSIAPGEVVGIAGRTGSGKSTLVKHLNGLLHPTSGRVLLGEADLADKRLPAHVRLRVGVAFQRPESQLFASTVYDDVAFGPRNLNMSPAEVKARVQEALEQVGLDFTAFARRSPFELSGGQQRRVALAGVLAMRPEVLVLDEPTASLDPASRASLLALINRLQAQGVAVVMVSHVMEDLARVAQRIVVLDQGSIALSGTPSEVFGAADVLA